MKQLALLCPEHIDKAEELGKKSCNLHQNYDVVICGMTMLLLPLVEVEQH